MGLRKALVRRLGRDVLTEVAEAAASKALREAAGLSGVDPDDHLWRSLSESTRGLPEWTHDRAIEVAFALYQGNPLGGRVTEINRDFIVGDGISRTVRNPQIDDVVGDFWEDEDNDLDQRLVDWALELGLFGEWVPEVFTGAFSGFVRLGCIDPGQIKAVDHVTGNPLIPDVVRIKQRGFGLRGKAREVVRRRDGQLSGDVFYFRVNGVSNSPRGWPDLLRIADWLDSYDRLVWEMAERSTLIRSFIWDVLIKGADDKQINEFLRRHGSAPKSGSVRAHNEEIVWQAVAPPQGSYEMAKEFSVIVEHIAAGAGLPKHWLANAGDVNRATALEMGAPTTRRLQQRQKYFLGCVRKILRFVLEQAEEAGKLRDLDTAGTIPVYDEDGNQTGGRKRPIDVVELHAPEVSPKDMKAAGDLLNKLSIALQTAESAGWISKKPIRELLRAAFTQLGYDYDPNADPVPERPEPAESRDSGEEVDPVAA